MDLGADELTSVQLVGADPHIMAEAAKLSYDLGAKFLDINMGCPVKKVVKTEAGSALMKNEKLAAQIITAIVKAVPIPVTLKIRLGWDNEHKNAPQIAKIAEDLGIQMLSIHARTRAQLYAGKADWKEVASIKNTVDIPVIVNGDIIDIATTKTALLESTADGVMIGRGALGSPWILKDIHDFIETGIENKTELSNQEKLKIAEKHLDYMLEFYEKTTAIKLSRKVLMYYCKGIKNASKYRQEIMLITDSTTQIKDLLFRIFE
jgi:tRNA-dihydrouridine synthase B